MKKKSFFGGMRSHENPKTGHNQRQANRYTRKELKAKGFDKIKIINGEVVSKRNEAGKVIKKEAVPA